MNTFKYEDIINITLERFPEFKDSEEFKRAESDLELPHVVYGWFMDFLKRIISENGFNDPIIKKFIVFTNEIFEDSNSDPKSLDLFYVEIFEGFYELKELFNFARNNFIGKVLSGFELTGKSRLQSYK